SPSATSSAASSGRRALPRARSWWASPRARGCAGSAGPTADSCRVDRSSPSPRRVARSGGARATGGERRQTDQLGSTAHTHLAKEPAELVPHREVRGAEHRGDLPVVVAPAHVIEDLLLARGEPGAESILDLARAPVAEADDR